MNRIYISPSKGKDLGALPSRTRNTFAQNAGDNRLLAIGRAGLSQSDQDEGSWSAIVDLIFAIVAHHERLALKRRALGRHTRRFARRNRKHRGRTWGAHFHERSDGQRYIRRTR